MEDAPSPWSNFCQKNPKIRVDFEKNTKSKMTKIGLITIEYLPKQSKLKENDLGIYVLNSKKKYFHANVEEVLILNLTNSSYMYYFIREYMYSQFMWFIKFYDDYLACVNKLSI